MKESEDDDAVAADAGISNYLHIYIWYIIYDILLVYIFYIINNIYKNIYYL
jgi:hypothetical protein